MSYIYIRTLAAQQCYKTLTVACLKHKTIIVGHGSCNHNGFKQTRAAWLVGTLLCCRAGRCYRHCRQMPGALRRRRTYAKYAQIFWS